MIILVSDTSVLIDLERGGLLEQAFSCGLTMVVPDLLYARELEPDNGPLLRKLGLGVVALNPDEVRRWGYQHDFPSPLNAFVDITHGAFGDARTLASDRTILPFYLTHRDAAIAEDAFAGIAAPHSGMLKYRLGILTSRFRANHPLKACPQCMAEDAHRFGAPYWHLKHQLPGVWVCPMHGLPLQTCKLKATGKERFAWLLPTQELLTKSSTALMSSGETLRCLMKLTELVISWASLPPGSLSNEHLGQIYRARLGERYGSAARREAAENYRTSIAPLPSARHCAIRLEMVWLLPVPGGPINTKSLPRAAAITADNWDESAGSGQNVSCGA